jgi:hypothetical protein
VVMIPCMNVLSSVNVADEAEVTHSVCNVASGAVRCAKLEYIQVEMSVVEIAIVDVPLYDTMKRLLYLLVNFLTLEFPA